MTPRDRARRILAAITASAWPPPYLGWSGERVEA
jgi:hypothetical protein